jgi:co-chaperonin GroES (HSP10)
MKFKPAGHRLLVKPVDIIENEELNTKHGTLLSKGFVIEKPDGQARRDAMGTDEGTVVAIGPSAWKHTDYGFGVWDDWKPWCKVGDKVTFGRYAGKLKEIDGIDYMVINDDDVQLVEEAE